MGDSTVGSYMYSTRRFHQFLEDRETTQETAQELVPRLEDSGNATLTAASTVAPMSTGVGVGARPIVGCSAVHPDERVKKNSDPRTGKSFVDQL